MTVAPVMNKYAIKHKYSQRVGRAPFRMKWSDTLQ
jgi:hypothetical protein